MVEEIELSILVNASVLAVALALLAADMINIDQPKIKQNRKRIWINHIVRKRYNEGTFRLLIPKLMSDEKQFHNFFRINKSSFDFLLTLIEADLTKKDTKMRCAISAKKKLALTLRYLATGICVIFISDIRL